MMRRSIVRIIGLFLCLVWPLITHAATRPSAIVEEIHNARTPIAALDYVRSGQVITLGPSGSLILDYLSSCIRERIEGGLVTVGETQSVVSGGEVKRLRVQCDGGAFQLTSAMAQQSAGMVFRGYDATKSKNLPSPQITLYGTSPVVKLARAGGILEIRRIDQFEQTVALPMQRAAEDLAALGVSLTPGGLYQAQAQGRGITFKIDLEASAGAGPVVSRLLTF